MQYKSLYIVFASSLLILASIVYQGSYAYFSAGVKGTGNKANNTSTAISDEISDLVIAGKTNIISNNLIPGESVSSTFTITNGNSIAICYTLNLENVTNTFINTEDLKVTLKDSNNTVLLENSIFPTIATTLKSGLKINANTTGIYTLSITYDDTSNNQEDDMQKSFGATITGILSDCP